MPKIKNWSKLSGLKWRNRKSSDNAVPYTEISVVDRRNRVNVDHNWAVVWRAPSDTRTRKKTLKESMTKEEAKDWAIDWMKNNP